MIQGRIYRDGAFEFHDGEVGQKLFVILGTDPKIAVVAKTTSKQHTRSNNHGCNCNDWPQNFYLSSNSCPLALPTWICLHEFYEYDLSELIRLSLMRQISHQCDLPDQLTQQIISCALQSEDITGLQSQIINNLKPA